MNTISPIEHCAGWVTLWRKMHSVGKCLGVNLTDCRAGYRDWATMNAVCARKNSATSNTEFLRAAVHRILKTDYNNLWVDRPQLLGPLTPFGLFCLSRCARGWKSGNLDPEGGYSVLYNSRAVSDVWTAVFDASVEKNYQQCIKSLCRMTFQARKFYGS